jgi:hypothetical protein
MLCRAGKRQRLHRSLLVSLAAITFSLASVYGTRMDEVFYVDVDGVYHECHSQAEVDALLRKAKDAGQDAWLIVSEDFTPWEFDHDSH